MIKVILILLFISILLQSFRIAILYFRSDISLNRKIIEIAMFIVMIIIEYYLISFNPKKIDILTLTLTIILSIYSIVMIIIERIKKHKYISMLSVKKAIDMSNNGIMFLDNSDKVILMNNTMKNILESFNIKKEYINNLIKNIDNNLLKCLDKVWSLKIDDNVVLALDITTQYTLQYEKELQNKEIEKNNKKLLNTMKNIKKIDKAKNLLKLKNDYHDILGHRFALFTKYLEREKKDIKDISFLLDSMSGDFDLNLASDEKLKNLIKLYRIVGIEVKVIGDLPSDEKIANIFFEIIRESVTNAIIHAESKNIKIIITQYLNRIEMIITNDGKKPNKIIYENEGIKGMRRKLLLAHGNLSIMTEDNFVLKATI